MLLDWSWEPKTSNFGDVDGCSYGDGEWFSAGFVGPLPIPTNLF